MLTLGLLLQGKKQHETDLVAPIDDQRVIAEVKNANRLGSNRDQRRAAARKRIQTAKMIEADQIILATTHTDWEPSSVAAIRTAIEEVQWNPSEPRVRVNTQLGTDEVSDSTLPRFEGPRALSRSSS